MELLKYAKTKINARNQAVIVEKGEEGPGQKSHSAEEPQTAQRTGRSLGCQARCAVGRGVTGGLRTGSLMATLIDFQSYSFKGKGNPLKIWQQVSSFIE